MYACIKHNYPFLQKVENISLKMLICYDYYVGLLRTISCICTFNEDLKLL